MADVVLRLECDLGTIDHDDARLGQISSLLGATMDRILADVPNVTVSVIRTVQSSDVRASIRVREQTNGGQTAES